MENSAHVLHCKLKNWKCRGGKCAGSCCCCCFQNFVTSLCFLRVFARGEKQLHTQPQRKLRKKRKKAKEMCSKHKDHRHCCPHPSKNKAARPPAATPAARLHYRKFTVCCLFDTHTCISYMLFVVMLRGKYCSHWQLYDYFTERFASYGEEKRGARDGNKTLLLLIKPQWNLTMLRFTIDGVSWLRLYRPKRNITFSLSTQPVWETSATQDMVSLLAGVSAPDKETHRWRRQKGDLNEDKSLAGFAPE